MLPIDRITGPYPLTTVSLIFYSDDLLIGIEMYGDEKITHCNHYHSLYNNFSH